MRNKCSILWSSALLHYGTSLTVWQCCKACRVSAAAILGIMPDGWHHSCVVSRSGCTRGWAACAASDACGGLLVKLADAGLAPQQRAKLEALRVRKVAALLPECMCIIPCRVGTAWC